MTKKSASKPASKGKPVKSAAKPEVNDKIGKAQLVDLVAASAKLTKAEAAAAFDAVLDVVIVALQSGKTVGLPGLGTLSVKATAARQGVKPGTSEKIQIPAGKKVAYKVASTLKSAL